MNNKGVAIVTGGNRGIGQKVCEILANRGFAVILTARTLQSGQEAAMQIRARGGCVDVYEVDVVDEAQIHAMVDAVLARYRHIDVLINNAGIYLDGPDEQGRYVPLDELSIDILYQTMDVNLYGSVRLTKAVLPAMRLQNYGRIVNVSSGMGRYFELDRRAPFYRLSKSALNAFTRILASEVAEYNILVNAVCPGWVRTRMGTKRAVRSITQGAKGVVWAATLPDGGPSGGLFRDGENFGW